MRKGLEGRKIFGIIEEGLRNYKEEKSPRIRDLLIIMSTILLQNAIKHHNSRY